MTRILKTCALFCFIVLSSCSVEKDDLNKSETELSNSLNTNFYAEVAFDNQILTIKYSYNDKNRSAIVTYRNTGVKSKQSEFSINENEKSIQIKEIQGLKRIIKISRNTEDEINMQFYVNQKLIDINNNKVSFADMIYVLFKNGEDYSSDDINKATNPDNGTVLIIGGRKSVTEPAAQEQADAYIAENPHCYEASGVDTSCLWDDAICVSSINIHCNSW